MGSLREDVTKNHLRKLSQKSEMKLISERVDARNRDRLIAVLRGDKVLARQIGQTFEAFRAKVQASRPDLARVSTISVSDWEERGYDGVAAVAKAVGLTKF